MPGRGAHIEALSLQRAHVGAHAPPGGEPVLLDFMVAAPEGGERAPLDAVVVDFGDAVQVFHVGASSCGVYGAPAGIAAAAARFGSRSLEELAAHAVALLIAIRFALGAGEAVIYPAANQFVARWVPVQERGFINGLIFAGVGAGSGLTPPLLTWLITHHGWRAAFWFSALIGLAAGAVWWLAARDTPEEHSGVSASELREIRDGLSFTPAVPVPAADIPPVIIAPVVISWRAIFHRRDLPALMAGYFSFGYVAWIFFSWFFLYMAQVRGFDLKSSARYAMLPFLSMTICCPQTSASRAASSSRSWRRETTMLRPPPSILVTRNWKRWPTYSAGSRRRRSTCDAGQNARSPTTCTSKPPLF